MGRSRGTASVGMCLVRQKEGGKEKLTATPISNFLDLTSDDIVGDSGADYGAGFYSYDGYHDSCFM